MTGRPRVRFTAREYLALLAASNLLDSYADDDPETHLADARAAGRAVTKVRASLTPADLREVDRRLGT